MHSKEDPEQPKKKKKKVEAPWGIFLAVQWLKKGILINYYK